SELRGALTLSGGELIVNESLTTSGTVNWSGGGVSGTGKVTNSGQWSLTGTNRKPLRTTFDNGGTFNHGGTGDFIIGGEGKTGTFNNLPGSLYDIQGDIIINRGDIRPSAFTNSGTLRKSSGSGTATIWPGLIFNNLAGTIDVRNGTLVIGGRGEAPFTTYMGGTFSVAAGATLDLTTGDVAFSRYIFGGTTTGSGEGQIRLNGGTAVAGPD